MLITQLQLLHTHTVDTLYCACGCGNPAQESDKQCLHCGMFVLTLCIDTSTYQCCKTCAATYATLMNHFDKLKSRDTFNKKFDSLKTSWDEDRNNTQMEFFYPKVATTMAIIKFKTNNTKGQVEHNTRLDLQQLSQFFCQYGQENIEEYAHAANAAKFNPQHLTQFILDHKIFKQGARAIIQLSNTLL